ncbi:MAG: hypothetical protein KME27_19090 [Lyngbya sp. HA4199-MV5]|jgi:hypothetical protein|nr:hypothetical protein [Lyngbya sp. HA4199-MV5]
MDSKNTKTEIVEYFQNNTVSLETPKGKKEASISVQSPIFGPPNQREIIVEFVIPADYVRLNFDSEIVTTSPSGSQPRAKWFDEENPKDGRIRLYAIAYAITQTGGVVRQASVRVFNVTGIREEER